MEYIKAYTYNYFSIKKDHFITEKISNDWPYPGANPDEVEDT